MFGKAFTTIALLTVVTMSQSAQAQDLHSQADFGPYVPGMYPAGNDRVIFITTEFRGSFNYQNVRTAFWNAARHHQRIGSTAPIKGQGHNESRHGNQNIRLGDDRYAVVGWYNVTRGEARYYGVKLYNRGRNSRWINHNGNQGTDDGFYEDSDRTNGWQVKIIFADDDNWGFSWRFLGPS